MEHRRQRIVGNPTRSLDKKIKVIVKNSAGVPVS